MVVLNGGEDILDRIPIPVMKLSWNDNPAEESIVHEEWKSAVETLLPRLLRPRKNSEDNGQQQRATEEDSSTNLSTVTSKVFIFSHVIQVSFEISEDG